MVPVLIAEDWIAEDWIAEGWIAEDWIEDGWITDGWITENQRPRHGNASTPPNDRRAICRRCGDGDGGGMSSSGKYATRRPLARTPLPFASQPRNPRRTTSRPRSRRKPDHGPRPRSDGGV